VHGFLNRNTCWETSSPARANTSISARGYASIPKQDSILRVSKGCLVPEGPQSANVPPVAPGDFSQLADEHGRRMHCEFTVYGLPGAPSLLAQCSTQPPLGPQWADAYQTDQPDL